MSKKIIVISFLCVLFSICNLGIYAKTEAEDYSESYKEYLKLSDEEKSKISAIPRMYDVTYEEFLAEEKQFETTDEKFVNAKSSLPSKFFLGDKIKLTVDYQGSAGWCWAFSSLNCAETYYQLNTGKDLNLAEYHLAYCRASELGGWRDNITVANSYLKGGNFSDFEKYVSYEYGPVLGNNSDNKDYKDKTEELLSKLNESPVLKVCKTIDFPSIIKIYDKNKQVIGYNMSDEELTDLRNKIKEHIMTNGSLYTVTDSRKYDTIINVYNTDDYQDHAISIVGWDDNYSKDNFKGANKPIHDGAYIIQNSWGTKYGDNGYYYVSYDDAMIEKEISGVVSINEIDYPVKANVEILGYDNDKNAVAVLLHSNQILKNMSKLGFEVYENNTKELDITYVKYYTADANENFDVEPYIGSGKANVKYSVKVADYPEQMSSIRIKRTGEKIVITSPKEIQLEYECSPIAANYTKAYFAYSPANQSVFSLYMNGKFKPKNNGEAYAVIVAKDGSGLQEFVKVEVNVDYEEQNENFKYNVKLRNGECYATIVKYIGTDKDVVIPAYINGMKVVKIGDNAFANNKEIESVVSYSSNITEIGSSAFSGCTNLKIVNIKDYYGLDAIKNIGDNAFLNCSNLITINTNNLSKIGKTAFKNCNSLKYFYLKYNLESIEADAFLGWDNTHYINFYNTKEGLIINLDFLNNCNANAIYEVSSCDSLTLSDTNIEFTNKNSKKITYTAFPIEDIGIDFVSTNNLVATVDKEGNITPNANGNCKIVVLTKDGSARAFCDVEVNINGNVVKGDYDSNGKVDVTDAYLLLTLIAKNQSLSSEMKSVMDMNLDNVIDVTDAYLLLKAISNS